jgi:hypothetical protein
MSDLERILKLLVVRVEEDNGGGDSGAPDDAEYIVGSPHAGLSAERSLVNGVNTTVDYGTPGQVSIDAPSGGAPIDAQYLTAAASAGLSAERVFQSGTNTAFASTATTAQVNVPNASTTVRGAVELATNGEVAAGLAVQANDGRLSDARTPLAHAASHQHGGSDEVATATPAANAIVKAQADNELHRAWIPDATQLAAGKIQLANDLAGDATNPSVVGIQNRAVNSSAPANGNLLAWDSTPGEWIPRALLEGEGIDLAVNANGQSTISAEDASTTNRGIVQLTNYLGGTATAPTVRNATGFVLGAIQLANYLGGTATAPTVRDATTNLKGAVELATNGETAANVVVQGNDSRLVQSEVFYPLDFTLSSNASLLTGTVTNGFVRISFANATGPDPFAWITTRLPDNFYGASLTLQVATRGAGTNGNIRLWWNLAAGAGGINGTANAGTFALGGSTAATLHTLSTTVNITLLQAGHVTLMVGRDHDHAGDTVNGTFDVLYARILLT